MQNFINNTDVLDDITHITQYICQLLNIDFSNNVITQEIGQTPNLRAFVAFCKENINHYDLKYLSGGTARLAVLQKMWLVQINHERLQKAQSQSQALCEKVGSVKGLLKRELFAGRMPRWQNLRQGKNSYFSEFEMRTLDTVGQVRHVLNAHDSHQLQARIEQIFEAQVLGGVTTRLSAPPTKNSRINAMLNIKRA